MTNTVTSSTTPRDLLINELATITEKIELIDAALEERINAIRRIRTRGSHEPLAVWEYLIVDDPATTSLSILGGQGWEMVGLTSLTVGGGAVIGGVGGAGFTVKVRYAFKRRIIDYMSDDEYVSLTNIKNNYLSMHTKTLNEINDPCVYPATFTGLRSAIQDNRFEAIDSILKTHQNLINITDSDDRTCLHIAVMDNNLEACKVLLRYGFNSNALDAFKNSPLYYAKKVNSEAIISLLSSHVG